MINGTVKAFFGDRCEYSKGLFEYENTTLSSVIVLTMDILNGRVDTE